MSWGEEPTLTQLARAERHYHRDQGRAPWSGPSRWIAAFLVGSVVWTALFPGIGGLFILDDRTEYDGIGSLIGFPLSMLAAFGVPTAFVIVIAELLVARVHRQWIHVAVIGAAAAAVTLAIQLALPFDLAHQPTYFLVPVASGMVAALGRLAAWPLVDARSEKAARALG